MKKYKNLKIFSRTVFFEKYYPGIKRVVRIKKINFYRGNWYDTYKLMGKLFLVREFKNKQDFLETIKTYHFNDLAVYNVMNSHFYLISDTHSQLMIRKSDCEVIK